MATRVRWLGHSCLLIEADSRNILSDPFLTGNPKAAASAEQVAADLILISHGHGDHVGDAVAIARRVSPRNHPPGPGASQPAGRTICARRFSFFTPFSRGF